MTRPDRHFAYVLRGTEVESGWGPRPDGYMIFEDQAQADAWLKPIEDEHASRKVTPLEYTVYDRLGYKRITPEAAAELAGAANGRLYKQRDREFLAEVQ